ncbi:SDR family NAD(P)-dependent oxidoreductase [Hyphococcus luteus]|uniref:NAD(P)-dependent oxidoreductase n=1 Tax=Hyphococcus luteus TaxID=2058213 RepID=A0A2S7JZI9_9PROT|nr:SDR family NAD(P)-dependent oxidoreductase [Marinicaulis flavus]PQA85677.1 NAD(P)-dependent oxidoreductase [Marinicaulis flavus]
MIKSVSLEGKRIIVTGASTGIGAAAAEIMGSLGAKVLVAARSEDKLKAVADKVTKAGGEGRYLAADMGSEADIAALAEKAKALWGGVDGVFANAGVSGPAAPMTEYSLDAYDDVMNVNLKSMFILIKAVLPGMIEQGSGSIVCTGSLTSKLGAPMTPAYVMSKHAVLGLVRATAAEVAKHNIRVNCLIPGLINTPLLEPLAEHVADGDMKATLNILKAMVPQGRVGEPEEAGWLAAFLLSDAAGYINAQSISADGGMLGIMRS